MDIQEKRLIYTKGMRAAAKLIRDEILDDPNIKLKDKHRAMLEDRIFAYETIITDLEETSKP